MLQCAPAALKFAPMSALCTRITYAAASRSTPPFLLPAMAICLQVVLQGVMVSHFGVRLTTYDEQVSLLHQASIPNKGAP